MTCYVVSVQRHIDAPPDRLFDLVADPAQHPVIDGSGSVRAVLPGNPARLSLGATFGMDMKLGARYRVTNTVIEFDEPHRIAWRHFNGHIWRYLFEGEMGGTLVTEQWDATRVWNRALLAIMGFPRRNREGMTKTLQLLADLEANRSARS